MMTGGEIAIVGVSGRFPGASDVSEFWENLKAGRESILASSEERAAETDGDAETAHWVRVNSLLKDVDLFDASFFGFSPREAEMIDPQQRIFLECAWEALEDAGLRAGDVQRHVGVFAGAALSAYIFDQFPDGAHLLETLPAVIANDRDYLATRTSYKMNFSGPSVTVQCACSTSLVAVHLACQSLIAGECDAALAGGVSAAVPRIDRYFYLPGAILSPDARCRAFDARARGTAFAEGVGVVVLMRLEDALRDNHRIYAVILGSAINNDASLKAGYTAPSIEGQTQVIRQAHAVAGIDASAVSYIEAHGTATVLGDAVELAALTRVFREITDRVGFCGLGSVKTNIGHLSTAAGVAGLIKTALALKHRLLPPSLNFEVPNPDLDLQTSPFYIATSLQPWSVTDGEPRRAGVSSFGIGGTNAHVVLQEAPDRRSGSAARPWQMLLLSARTESALARTTGNLRDHLARGRDDEFADVAYTSQVGRRHFDHRRAVICATAAEAVAAIDSLDADHVMTRKGPAAAPLIAFMFPGQGAQAPGMGAGLYQTEPVFRDHVDACLARLAHDLDVNLRPALYPAPGEEGEMALRLQETELAQPALFVTEYALARLLESWGIRPAMMIGHSLGEYVAACLSGVLSLDDALHLVAVRGRLMQRMATGSMLSVPLPVDDLIALLPDELSVAAVNGPAHCVVSGPSAAIAELEAQLVGRGIPCRPLRTSHAFHSRLIEPMLTPFAREIGRATIGIPRVPYVSNLSGRFVTEDEIRDGTYWARQIRQPVLFAKGIETLVEQQATLLVEVGPGRTLSTLAKQCGVEARHGHVVTTMPGPGDPAEAFSLMRAIGRMWLAGVSVDWEALHADERRQRVSLPTYPFERQRFWSENKRAQQPPADAGKKSRVAEWFYTPSWRRVGPARQVETSERPERRPVLVFGDSFGIGRDLAATLREAGVEVTTVEPGLRVDRTGPDEYTMDPANDADYEALLTRVVADGRHPSHVVHLWSLSASTTGADDITTFRREQQHRLFSLLRLVSAFERVHGVDRVRFDIVSNGLFDIVGDEPLLPQNSPLLAFTKVVPQEHQTVACRIVDIVLPAEGRDDTSLVEGLAAHVGAEPEERIVAFRNGNRWAQRFDAVDTTREGRPTPLKRGGVYLITGGLGKIGLTLADFLARQYAARLVLTGRSPLPEKSEWPAWLEHGSADENTSQKVRALCAMESGGGEVWVTQANAASEEDMRGVRRFVEEKYGRLDGIVFAAGRTTLHRSVFEETGVKECEAHFEAKVHGLMVLERVFDDVPLDFCVVLSSLSTILGGLGHMAYSAANQVADALVHRRNRTRRDAWTTVNWDAWQFDELADASTGMKAALTRLSMLPQEGVEAFDLLLRLPVMSQVVISTGHLQSRVDDWIALRTVRGESEAAKEAPRSYARPDLDTPYAETEGDLERRVADIWKSTLGLDRIGRNDDFFELGGHSLLAIQVLAQVRQIFGVDFPIDRAFEATTVRKAAEVVDELLREKISRLTDAEAEELLKQTGLLDVAGPGSVA